MPEAWQLTQMQGLPLELKVKKTILRIREWYEAWDGDVFVSFSGGKDSTVLLHIARSIYPGIEAVFDDTGLEYPEIRDFVKTIENVTWIKPKMSFRKVIDKYGYPVVSKSVANTLRGGDKVGSYRWKKLHGQVFLKNGSPSKFNCEKWRFLLDAPFKVSDECCDVMKKRPFHQYERDTGRKSIVATMADESTMRKNSWEKYGCNAFDRVKGPQSRPMSFWTEKDVLLYIVTRKLSYARVYGQIRAEYRGQVIPPPFCAKNDGSVSVCGTGIEALHHWGIPYGMNVLYVRMSSGKDSEPFSEDAGYSPQSVEVLHEACQRRRTGRAGSPGIFGSPMAEGGRRWTGKLTSVSSATSPGCEKTSVASTVSEGAARTQMEPVIVFLITRSIGNSCESKERR